MTDREAVISELVERIEATLAVGSEWVNMPLDLVQYAVHMLDGQEPVAPRYKDPYHAYCGACGCRIPLKIKARYCHKCGRKVKWDDP